MDCNGTGAVGRTPQQQQLGLFLYLFSLFITFSSLLCFLQGKYKWKLSYLRRRHTILILSLVVGSLCQAHSDPFEMMISSFAFPCALNLCITVNIIPFIGGSVVGRLMTFYFRSRFEHEAQAQRLLSRTQEMSVHPLATGNGGDFRSAPSAILTTTEDEESQPQSFVESLQALFIGANELFFLANTPHLMTLSRLRYLQSGRVTIVFVLFMFVVPSFLFAGLMLGLNTEFQSCPGCTRRWEVGLFFLLQISLTLVYVLLAVYRSRKFPDAWGILPETLWSVVGGFVAGLGYALQVFMPKVDEDSVWEYTVIMSLGVWSLNLVQTLLQVYYGYRLDFLRGHPLLAGNRIMDLDNENDSKHVATTLPTITALKLDEVLRDPEMFKQFETHLVREFAVESLYFLRDAQKWTSEHPQLSASARTARAKKLVNLYIRPNAVMAINLPSALTQELLLIVEGKQDPPVSMFLRSMQEIVSLLERGALIRFSAQFVSS